MQKTTLKVTMENGKVLSDMGLILPCSLEEFGCETISPDANAYIWDYPNFCVVYILRTENVNMVKQDTKYYVLSEKVSTSKFVFEIKNISKNIVRSPHLFTQQTTIHFIWLNSVKVSIRKPEETSAARRMFQLKTFSFRDPERNTILANFMRIIVSWNERSSIKQKVRTVI